VHKNRDMQKLAVACLCSKRFWRSKTSRCRFEYFRAVAAHPEVEAVFTGPGFQGWDSTKSVAHNLGEIGQVDVAWAYKPEEMAGFGDLLCTKIVSFNESWWDSDKAARECLSQNLDLVVCHHQNDLARFTKFGLKAVNIPHAIEPAFYGGLPLADRKIDCLLTGALSEEHYPLRMRYVEAIRQHGLPCEIRPHPGYRMISETAADAQYSDYIHQLHQAKVSLCCTSKWRYLLRKLLEAAGSGSIVVTDQPDDDNFECLSRYCWVIHQDMSSKDIAEYLMSRIPQSPGGWEELHQQQQMLRDVVTERFSTNLYATRFIEAARDAIAAKNN
jgi:hypothetical protein